MSLAARHEHRLRLGRLASEAVSFSRAAPRQLWLITIGLVVVHAYMFARGHIAFAVWPQAPLDWIAPFGLVLYVPLFGGLYRLAIGGKRLRGLGAGGLQWRGLEWRLIGVGMMIALLIGMVALPFMLINLLVILLLGVRAHISLGPFGGWARWAPETALIWLVFLWLMAPRGARLMLGSVYSSARGRIDPLGGWEPARFSGWTLAAALVLALCPLLLGWLALVAMELVEPDVLSGQHWPVAEAVGSGLMLGVLEAAVAAPLCAGVLAAAWWMLERETRVAELLPLLTFDPFSTGPVALGPSTAGGETSALDPQHRKVQPQDSGLRQDVADLTKSGQPSPDDAAQPGALGLAPEAADGAKIHVESKPDPTLTTIEPPTHHQTGAPLDEYAIGQSPGYDGAATAPGISGPLSNWPHSVLPPWPAGLKAEPLASEDEPAHPSRAVSERD